MAHDVVITQTIIDAVLRKAPEGVEVDAAEILHAIGALLHRAQCIQSREDAPSDPSPGLLWRRLMEALRYTLP